MWKIVYVRLLNLRKNYIPYLIMLAFPLIFTFIFGAMIEGGAGQMLLPVVDRDNSEYSAMLVRELENLGTYEVRLSGEEELKRIVAENRADMGLIIPGDFQETMDSDKTPRLDLVITTESTGLYSFEGVLRGCIQKIAYNFHIINNTVEAVAKYVQLGEDERERLKERVEFLANEKWENKVPITVKSTISRAGGSMADLDGYTQSSIGFTIAFSMFTFIFAVGEILDEKRNKVWHRINISPLSKLQIYSGNLIYACALGLSQMLILAVIGDRVLGVNWSGNIPGVLVMLTTFTFSTVALGLLMSTLVKSNQQLQVLAPVVLVSTGMIGGCYWPLEIVSSRILLTASRLVPQGWAMKGLKDIIVYNQGFEAVYLPSAVLVLMGVIFMGLALQVSEKLVK